MTLQQGSLHLAIGHLYPRQMNIYGDRGNIICLRERCLRRGIQVTVGQIAPGEPLGDEPWDILFIGGGQDREQRRIAEDLLETKGEALRTLVEKGGVVLAVCGGFQLLGRRYRPAEGPDLPGLGIFDMETIHPGPRQPRCIGNLVAQWQGRTLVGFENHGGRTYLGPQAEPLARVLRGHGNNGEDGTEGARYKHAFGTYLHGSFLPKNPHFADHLLQLALERRYGSYALPPLQDDAEEQAHSAAVSLAHRNR